MALLSIIVPVYNVSAYLSESLDSLIAQSVQDVEIICIDDCSTDTSLDLLESYQKQDDRIVILRHTVNKGLASTRNTGIKYATGKYIAFVDPDDRVSTDMYQTMITAMEKYGVDVVQCGFITFPNNIRVIPNFPHDTSVSPYSYIAYNKCLHSSGDLCYSWRFLLKRKVIVDNGLFFNENIRLGEDAPFNLQLMMCARKILCIPQPLYHYRVNNANSLMKQKHKPWMEESLKLQIEDKKKIGAKYGLDQYMPFSRNMSEDIVKRYTLMLFANLKEKDKIVGVKRILNMEFVRNAFNEVGYKNIYPSFKEYLFYLLMKWKMYRLVCRYI